jgi:hypothetical protein
MMEDKGKAEGQSAIFICSKLLLPVKSGVDMLGNLPALIGCLRHRLPGSGLKIGNCSLHIGQLQIK